MKRILLFGAFCISFLSITSAAAFDMQLADSVEQGTTLEIAIPGNNLAKVQGTLAGKEIKLFEMTQTPSDFEPISRGEFLSIIFKNHSFGEINTSSGTLFPDVPLSQEYATDIYKAQTLGIIKGYEDGRFHTYDPLTRAQAAKILMLAFSPAQTVEISLSFSDLSPTHSLASYMYQAMQAGLFKGYGDGTVKPDRFLNFAEAETLLKRASGLSDLKERTTQKFFRGFVGLHRINDIGDKKLVLNAETLRGEKESFEKVITVLKRKYNVESFSLPPSKTTLFGNDAYSKTWAMIDGAKKTTNSEKLWEGNFIVPAEGEVSMGFGDTVYINGSLSGSHFGIDYANKTGTPVHASNNGKIVLSDYTPSYGHTVIIDHGQNVFTMYMHMSERKTAKDDMVKKGDVIGLVGATGIATGPHLHFTHFIGDVIVDSREWYEGKYE
ncbi:MAG: peptidoglycan DD-metalloendopeptidase family protein [Candidatus Gracilibacteria bacterium]